MSKIFVDMDGTVANFFEMEDCLERMYEEGFFYNLKPLAFANFINEMATYDQENIYILSACVDTTYCRQEKMDWLDEYIPFVKEENIILCNIGENKADIIKAMGIAIDKECILYDDYTKNLVEWELAGGHGIKALNGINHITKKWKGEVIVACA